MRASNVPEQFLGEVVLSATHLINRMPSRTLDFKTLISTLQTFFPTSKIFSSVPLKIFGCSTFVHNLNPHRSKLDPKSIKCIFLGYSPHQKGYRCYSLQTRKFNHTMDITFFENQPYYTKDGIQGEQSHLYPIKSSEYQFLALEETEPTQIVPDQTPNTQPEAAQMLSNQTIDA